MKDGRASLIAGAGLCALFVLAALISTVWTPHDVAGLDASARFQPPSPAHWMGANHLGRDVFSMVMAGAQVSIAVAFFAVGLGAVVGVPLGLAAAAAGGPLSDVIMRGGDLIFAFPAIILAILLAATLGPGALNAVIAIGVFNIPVFARLARAGALPLWTSGYVLSARTAGRGAVAISIDHILPNIAHLLIVQMTVQFSMAVLAEAGLSYVGLGVQPPAPSWGRMLAESQTMAGFAPWLAIFPGLAIFLFVFGINLLGDGLRHALDPQRERAP